MGDYIEMTNSSHVTEHLSQRHEQWLRLGLYVAQALLVALFVWSAIHAPRMPHESMVKWQYVFDGIVFCVLLIGVLTRGSARGLWELIATLWVLPGVWFACLVVFPYELGLSLAALVTLCGLIVRLPAFQWIMCAIGIVGIAINLGTTFPPDFLLLALVAWAAYDMLLPLTELQRIGSLPGTMFELRGRTDEPLLMPADVVLPMGILVSVMIVKPETGWIVGGGMALASILVFLSPISRRQLTVAVLAVGAVVPYTILRMFGML